MRIKILAELELPSGVATNEEILEWLRFELGDIGQIPNSNPLVNKQLSVEFGSTKFEIKNP